MCRESGQVTWEMGKGRVVRREGRGRERGCEDEHRGWLMGEGGESKSGMTLITGPLGEVVGGGGREGRNALCGSS